MLKLTRVEIEQANQGWISSIYFLICSNWNGDFLILGQISNCPLKLINLLQKLHTSLCFQKILNRMRSRNCSHNSLRLSMRPFGRIKGVKHTIREIEENPKRQRPFPTSPFKHAEMNKQ